MRRKEREITDIHQLQQILEECKVCRVAMQDKDGLYLIPLNFGYQYQNGKLTLYLHSAKEGRKISALSQNSSVCFEMDCSHKLVEGDVACAYSYEYQSIVGYGTARIVEDKEEKKQALSILMKHMTEKKFEFTDSMADLVAVIKIEADSFSGKGHQL